MESRSSRRTRRPRAAHAGTSSPLGPSPTKNTATTKARTRTSSRNYMPTCPCSILAPAARPRRSPSAILATFSSPGRTKPFSRSMSLALTNSRSSVPSLSIKAEPPVALVDKVVDAKGTRKFAEAYLDFLYTPQAQKLIAPIIIVHQTRSRPIPTISLASLTSSSCPSTIRCSGGGPRRSRSTLRMAAPSTKSTSLRRPIEEALSGTGVVTWAIGFRCHADWPS